MGVCWGWRGWPQEAEAGKAKAPAPSGGSRNPLAIAANLVQALLEKYFVVTDDVKVRLMGLKTGQAELLGMRLKTDALAKFKLPVHITHSFARFVRLTFPNLFGIVKNIARHQDIKLTVEIADITSG
jgi:hypothetical protein